MYQPKTPPHLLTLVLLSGFSPLTLNMFLPSLAKIADEMATDYATVSWSVSAYLAVTAIIQLLVGPLSDRIGRRPVLLVAVLIFGCASVGCALAQDIYSFLFFRILQGGITAGYTLSLAIVRDTRSERQAVSLIGYIGMSMAVAPMLGPVLGGVMDTFLGWRSIFIFYAVSGFVLLAVCWFDLGETNRQVAQGPGEKPVRTAVLVREPLFWAFSLCGAFSVGSFYVFLTGAPLVALSTFGVSTAELGVYIGTITLGFMAGGFLAGRYGARFGTVSMMIAGRIVACFGLIAGLLLLALGNTIPQLYFASTVFVGLGNGITIPGSNAGAMSLHPELAGSAAGLNGALMVATGALLTAVTGSLVTEASGDQTLLLLMLCAALAGLFLAIWAAWLRRHARA
ncbi:MAG: multidrug effflux MFS transporter [Pseudomonadota bacterium]